jgi:hypothetical protein
MMTFASFPSHVSALSTLQIALEDASRALSEALEKETARALSTGMKPAATLGVNCLTSSGEHLPQPQKSHCSPIGDEDLEDPIMAGFLESQRAPPELDFDDWARVIAANLRVHHQHEACRTGTAPLSTNMHQSFHRQLVDSEVKMLVLAFRNELSK